MIMLIKVISMVDTYQGVRDNLHFQQLSPVIEYYSACAS